MSLENIATGPLEEIPVSELNLSIRGRRRLEQLRINNICDILKFDIDDLMGNYFGIASLNQLQEELGKYNIRLKTRKQREHEEICREIYGAMSNGAKSQVEVARMINRDVDIVRYRARIEKIQLPKGKRGVEARRIPERDRDIADGLSLREYGDRWNISHQGASDYIERSGQYGIWKNARYERLEREKEWKELEKQERKEERYRLLLDAYERAKEINDWAYQKVVEYCILTNGKKSINFDKLIKLFDAYYGFLEGNWDPNYLALSKKSGLRWETVKGIIKTIEPWLETD